MKRKLNFLRPSLFNHYLAGLYLSSSGRTKDHWRTHYAKLTFWNIIYKFGFKIELVDRLFLQVERTFLACHVHQKLAFSEHLIAQIMREFKYILK